MKDIDGNYIKNIHHWIVAIFGGTYYNLKTDYQYSYAGLIFLQIFRVKLYMKHAYLYCYFKFKVFKIKTKMIICFLKTINNLSKK